MDIEKYLFNENIPPTNKNKLYNFLGEIEQNSEYTPKIEHNIELADFISKNYDTMSKEEMKFFALKCLTEHDLCHILLKYELHNLERKPLNICLKEFSYIASKILFRYQSRAGGFYFGDRTWKMYNITSNKYTIYDNEIIFENTIGANNLHDNETKEFLQGLLLLLNNISTRVKVSIHMKFSDRDKIYTVMLKCCEML